MSELQDLEKTFLGIEEDGVLGVAGEDLDWGAVFIGEFFGSIGDFLDAEGGVVEVGMFRLGDALAAGGRRGTLGYAPFPSDSLLPTAGLLPGVM